MGLGSSSSDTSEEDEEREEINEGDQDDGEGKVDYRRKVMGGSFLPAIVLLDRKLISVEGAIDPN